MATRWSLVGVVTTCLSLAGEGAAAGNRPHATVQERLGYPADAKLLVVHADDLGLAHAENQATFAAMESGIVTAASVMPPTPWALEVAEYVRERPEAAIGVHLTLTSEWKHYKWGPLGGAQARPSLVNEAGVFHSAVPEFARAAALDEVESELRQQIARARQLGLDVTHLDVHMGALSATPALAALAVRLAEEQRLPLRLTKANAAELGLAPDSPLYLSSFDSIHGAPTNTYPDGMKAHYDGVLRALPPGLHLLVLHVAYDDAEMQAITVDHPLWGSRWRQIDYEWAVDPATRRLIEEEGITLISLREVRDKLFGAVAPSETSGGSAAR